MTIFFVQDQGKSRNFSITDLFISSQFNQPPVERLQGFLKQFLVIHSKVSNGVNYQELGRQKNTRGWGKNIKMLLFSDLKIIFSVLIFSRT